MTEIRFQYCPSVVDVVVFGVFDTQNLKYRSFWCSTDRPYCLFQFCVGSLAIPQGRRIRSGVRRNRSGGIVLGVGSGRDRAGRRGAGPRAKRNGSLESSFFGLFCLSHNQTLLLNTYIHNTYIAIL